MGCFVEGVACFRFHCLGACFKYAMYNTVLATKIQFGLSFGQDANDRQLAKTLGGADSYLKHTVNYKDNVRRYKATVHAKTKEYIYF